MKKKYLLCMMMLVLASGCGSDSDDDGGNSTPIPTPVPPVEKTQNLLLTGEFNNENIYAIFTNKDTMKTADESIYVVSKNTAKATSINPSIEKENLYMNSDILNLREKEKELFEINEKRRKSGEMNKAITSRNTTATLEKVGTEVDFHTILTTATGADKNTMTPAILIKQVTPTSGENRTLNIWLAKSLVEGSNTYKSDYNVDVLADNFLKEGKNNDIYEYITSIYGTEWYDSNVNVEEGIIGATKTIDILLYNINEDYKSPYGVVVGFFYNLNNFLVPDKTNYYYDYYKNSNERIMFNLDATMLKYDSKTVISTLGHEFVHTINFYQKNVLNHVSMDSWMNEMLAMMGEDIVADKLGVPGPRGITNIESTVPTSSEKAGYEGRFYSYNSGTTNSLPVNDQDGSFDVNNYSQTYAYGAYLLRNMIPDGGNLSFIKNIVNNQKSDHEAIEYALNVAGINKTFEETIQDFSKATLLSDNKFTGNEDYKYNVSRTFNNDGIQYKLGPINVHNYTTNSIPGFVTYGTNYYNAPDLDYGGVQYFKLGEGLNGKNSFELHVPAGVDYQIVVKESNGIYNKNKSEELQESMVEID